MKSNDRTNRCSMLCFSAKTWAGWRRVHGRVAFAVCLFGFILLASMQSARMASADQGGYHIKDYQVNAVLHENNVLEIQESIQVNFSQKRHGIYRNIATDMYVSRDTSEQLDGSSSKVMHYANKVRKLKIKDWEYDTSTEDGNYIIQIGDEDKTVSGDQLYQISYQYSMPDDRLENSDFLFYSVLGAGWKTRIDHFSFELDFEKPLSDQAQADLQIYSGKSGSEENSIDVMYDLTSDKITGEAYQIAPNQAITIFTELPQGYFKGARRTPSLPFQIMLVFTLLLSIVLLVIEFWKKDAPVIETVEFHPPHGMSSAEVGTIIDETVDDVDMMSLIPWWANEGYLLIEEVPDKKGRGGEHAKILLHLQKKLPEDAPEYQKRLMKALFPKDREIADLSKLKKKFADKFEKAKMDLQKIYSGEKKLSTGTATAVCSVFLLCVTYALEIGLSSQVSLTESLPGGLIAAVVLLVFGCVRLAMVPKDALRSTGAKIALSIYGLCSWVVALICTAFACLSDPFLSPALLLVSTLLVMPAIWNAGKLIHATAYKREMQGKLLGLRRFIQTAELDRLKMLVDENPSYYYDVLPYAMAFGLMDDWAKRFESMTLQEPDWYSCDDHSLFTVMYLNHQINHHIQKPIDNIKVEAAAADVSSGGGGFSGGGAVGGGGGSW